MQPLGVGEYGLGAAIISTLPEASTSTGITFNTKEPL